MRRFLPFLFVMACCLQPVLNFVTANVVDSSCSLTRSIGYFFILLGFAAAFFLGLSKILKKEATFSYIFSGLVVLGIFNYFYIESALVSLLKESFRFRYFMLVGGAFLFLLFGLSKFLAKSQKSLQVLTVFIFSFIGADLALFIKSMDFNDSLKIAGVSVKNIKKKSLPNVYYLIPDMFIGPEAFKQFSGQELYITKQLEELGFKVNYNTFSSAPSTRMSLAQVFAMDYLLAQYKVLGSNSFRELSEVYFNGKNPVIQGFKERGYKYIRFADGYVSMCDGKEDRCYRKSMFFNTQDVRFLERTKFISFLNHYLMKGNTLSFPTAMEMQDFMKYIPQKDEGPYFLLVHLSLPHPPIRYDSECHLYPEGTAEYKQFNRQYEFSESQAERFNSIIPQIRCSEKLVYKLMIQILKNDPQGIIIVQADHGTSSQRQSKTPIENFTEQQFFENFNILSAFRLPLECAKFVGNHFAPVNNFRVVFSCIDGTEPELLPQRSFLTYYTQQSVQNGERVVVTEWNRG